MPVSDVLEAAPDGMIIVDEHGTILLVNRRTEELFRHARGELIGQPIEMLVPSRLRAVHASHRGGYFQASRVRTMGSGLELFGLRKDGTEFPVEISLAPLETADGPLVSCAIRDVTERARMEAARARLAAIVDSSEDAIIGKTLDGVVTSWNEGARRLFGWEAAEVVGRGVAILLPDGMSDPEAELRARVARGERVPAFETQRRHKEGLVIDVWAAVSPIHDRAGAVIGVSMVLRDISERKRALEAIARAKLAAEVASRELEAFSYSVAHDLRAPLRSIDGFSQALLEDNAAQLDEQGRRYLGRVRESAQHMAQLIDGLLNLARVTRGDIRRERVDLSAIAQAVVDRLRRESPARPITIEIDEQLVDEGDPGLLGVVLDNLLANAWKFTRHVPQPTISFRRTSFGPPHTYCVSDDGAGFDPRYASKLFGVFQRLHRATEFEGTGVGLATVQRIVTRHRGRIWAEGAVGSGARFFFTLHERGEP